MARKTTSIKIDDDLWREFRIYALQKRKDMSEIIEGWIRKELRK